MRGYSSAAIAGLLAMVGAASLGDLCTVSAIQEALPANGTLLGIDLIPSSVTANVVKNATAGSDMGSGNSDSTKTYDYCNVTVQYTHTGRSDAVSLWYFLPSPDDFQNRYLGIGGGGYSISMGSGGLSAGLAYGAVAGTTNGGFGDGFSTSADEVNLLGNGTINYEAVHMFGYKALGEATVVGKALSRGFYSLATDSKIFTYFSGCSDGGREAWSQIQRWGEVYDGVVAGAPAFRYSHQQVGHLTSNVVEHTLKYYPPPCELEKIVNLTIAACDPLDGRTDGVVSRSDLCKLKFDIKSTVGTPYYCAAENHYNPGLGFSKRHSKRQSAPAGSGTSYQPAQNGTISAKGVEVAQTILDGLKDLQGRQAYVSAQPSSDFADAQTEYDNATSSWTLSIASTGGEFVKRFIMLEDGDNIDSLDGVTYDTMVEWMTKAMVMYSDSLQTTLPDLTVFSSHGGKVIHYHGESDSSIPAASSVHYYDSVRSVMYPNLPYHESVDALSDWYRFFLVPGAGHCGTSQSQPGPWPDNLQSVINWVENDVAPDTVPATVASGPLEGESQPLCAWPLRPYWSNNGNAVKCEYDQASIDSWTYSFDAFKLPIY
ncbi:hypothetical protein DL764_006094 [Monosporascus ibericus]|uniref:Carboxylic ester hydrolase n=1 Tax=Monosporascus ibericus TaxID=155417 RepID=A0A4Q4T8W0_9PEZI|nr:hypothetical protein DL764_006094 [Monosporascus ibericus]